MLGVQRTKCLVGSELDMAKKIVREKDARCCKLKYKREVKNNYSILFCFWVCFCGLLLPFCLLIVFYFFFFLCVFCFCAGFG